MEPSDIRKSIQEFVSFIEKPANPVNLSLLRLIDTLLARLAQSHAEFNGSDYPSAPDHDYQANRLWICQNFPKYGYYNIADEVIDNVGQSGCLVGDAVDDLTDLYQDMRTILWYWDHTGIDNALWYFKEEYGFSHWENHARNLQYYLFALLQKENS